MDYRNEDIQANILKGHGRKHAGYVFFSLKRGADIHRQRELLAQFGRYEVTSYQKQVLDTQMFKDGLTEGECFVKGLYISHKGFASLRVKSPLETPGDAFEVGMNHSSQVKKLGDYNTIWDRSLAELGDLHGLILVAHSSREQVKKEVIRIQKTYLDPIAKSHCQYAEVEKDENGFFKDHFGYSDGVSTPRDESVLAEYALVKETGQYSYGSFVAFRKIEQDLKHFEYMLYDLEVKLGKRIFSNRKYYMALLMGRFPNGTPLTRFKEERPVEEWIKNDFDYEEDKDGSKCPLQAHIRMVNPRGKNANGEMIPPPKIVRRSMRYEDDDKRKGLCFLSYQSSLDENFVPLFYRMGVDNEDRKKDVITYRPRLNSRPLEFEASYSLQYGDPSNGFITQFIGGNHLTTFRGGQYFYAPSIPFLRDLEKLGAPE
jgi:Dyp-type peroxidase family